MSTGDHRAEIEAAARKIILWGVDEAREHDAMYEEAANLGITLDLPNDEIDALAKAIEASIAAILADPQRQEPQQDREALLIGIIARHVLRWHAPSLSAACADPACGMDVVHLYGPEYIPEAQARHQAAVIAALDAAAPRTTLTVEQVGHFLSEWLDDSAPLYERRYVQSVRALVRQYPALKAVVS